MGLWGTSFAGGHAVVLGATDRRLKCVVSQVPIISGYEQTQRRVQADNMGALEEMLTADERTQARGEAPRRQAIASKDPTVPASYRAPDAVEFYLQPIPDGIWGTASPCAPPTQHGCRARSLDRPGVSHPPAHGGGHARHL